MRPKVLIVCKHEAERDTMRVLVGTMGCQWVMASDLKEALGILNREPTTAAILDSRCDLTEADAGDLRLREFLVRLPGRVIVLADKPPGSATNELVRKYALPFVQRDRLTQDLWSCMEWLMQPDATLLRVKEVARLILDTFSQPHPAGVRYLQTNVRHLVYETEAIIVDISFELLPETNHMFLAGQVMREGSHEPPVHDVSVVLKGQMGPLGLAVTNESGEFSFEFAKEPSVTLEIEDRPNHRVTIISPKLHWGFGHRETRGDASESENITRTRKHDPPQSKGK